MFCNNGYKNTAKRNMICDMTEATGLRKPEKDEDPQGGNSDDQVPTYRVNYRKRKTGKVKKSEERIQCERREKQTTTEGVR